MCLLLTVPYLNAPTFCKNKQSLSRSPVSRDLYQGKVVLVVHAVVLSGIIYISVTSPHRTAWLHSADVMRI